MLHSNAHKFTLGEQCLLILTSLILNLFPHKSVNFIICNVHAEETIQTFIIHEV